MNAIDVHPSGQNGEDAFPVIRSIPVGEGTEKQFIAAEEVPVALVFNGSTTAVLMATPTDLRDFAIGFAISEEFIRNVGEIEDLQIIPQRHGIEARFWLRQAASEALKKRTRNRIGPVGCGLCGIDSLEQANRPLPSVAAIQSKISKSDILAAVTELSERQPLHDITRAMHGSAFVGLNPKRASKIATVREDVGRHNALDKLIGALVGQNVPADEGAILMTSRISVDLVQKCAISECAILIGVSSPTALAVRTAQEAGLTLVTLSRRQDVRIFTHPHRVAEGI